MILNIKNTYYENLVDKFYSKINPAIVKNPKIIIFNEKLAAEFNIKKLEENFLSEILSGNKLIDGSIPIAQAYAGHQFGYFNMLGDGRAILLGEIEKNGKLYDIQLKGAGKTPYSRKGDGKAALAPMLREYIISEAMYYLNIPTTKSLAVVQTEDIIYRENEKIGAILTRIASSHIRVGTFEYISNFGDNEDLKKLADYTINRHFPEINLENTSNKRYLIFFKKVIDLQAKLIAKWMLVGFIHGVMNTDNVLISGETIDYGPCAFMDNYDSNTVFSSIDIYGRYRYKNQPYITAWNLTIFAEALLPLFEYTHNPEDNNSINTKEAINFIEEELLKYNKLYKKYWLSGMRAKLGLFSEREDDEELFYELLNIMEEYKADYTNTFVALTKDSYEFEKELNYKFYESTEFKAWNNKWKIRILEEGKTKEEVKKLMEANNPFIIPRNQVVEETLADCEKGNFEELKKLLEILKKPYEYNQKVEEKYFKVNYNTNYKTFCGT